MTRLSPDARGEVGSHMSDRVIDVEKVATALGAVPRVSYEAAHVYPLSAPDFQPSPGMNRAAPPPGPLRLYVHVPFCNYACSFCFYVKQVRARRDRMARYVAAVCRELECVAPGTPLAQLYVGGGTPTALPADLLDEVLEAVLGRMPPAAGASLTVEASPESLSAAHVAVLRRHGVERVSLGLETLDAGVLRTINRLHTFEHARAACALVAGSGLVANVDLMYGLPGQTEESFTADLAQVASWGLPSVSLYSLRLNERTPLARAVDADDRLDLERLIGWRTLIHREMQALGYVQTRWHTFVRRAGVASTFGRAPCVDGFGAGRQLGLGVSAVSHLGDRVYRNHERLDDYLACVESGESTVEATFSLAVEEERQTLFVARTLGDGRPLDRAEWRRAFGRPIERDLGDVLQRLRDADLVHEERELISLTEGGRLVYDLVTLAFYPAHARRWLGARQHLA
jgi:oxygen-independent coproporphyrinogen III oxidase